MTRKQAAALRDGNGKPLDFTPVDHRAERAPMDPQSLEMIVQRAGGGSGGGAGDTYDNESEDLPF